MESKQKQKELDKLILYYSKLRSLSLEVLLLCLSFVWCIPLIVPLYFLMILLLCRTIVWDRQLVQDISPVSMLQIHQTCITNVWHPLDYNNTLSPMAKLAYVCRCSSLVTLSIAHKECFSPRVTMKIKVIFGNHLVLLLMGSLVALYVNCVGHSMVWNNHFEPSLGSSAY